MSREIRPEMEAFLGEYKAFLEQTYNIDQSVIKNNIALAFIVDDDDFNVNLAEANLDDNTRWYLANLRGLFFDLNRLAEESVRLGSRYGQVFTSEDVQDAIINICTDNNLYIERPESSVVMQAPNRARQRNEELDSVRGKLRCMMLVDLSFLSAAVSQLAGVLPSDYNNLWPLSVFVLSAVACKSVCCYSDMLQSDTDPEPVPVVVPEPIRVIQRESSPVEESDITVDTPQESSRSWVEMTSSQGQSSDGAVLATA